MSKYFEELQRHLEDCENSKMRHFDFSDISDRRRRLLASINSIVLALILAWVLSTQLETILPEENWLYEVFPLAAALVLAGLNAFEARAGFDRDYDSHLAAAKRYHRLWRDIKNLDSEYTDCESDDYCQHVRMVRERLNQINDDSPHITLFQQKAIDSFRTKQGWTERNEYEIDTQ